MHAMRLNILMSMGMGMGNEMRDVAWAKAWARCGHGQMHGQDGQRHGGKMMASFVHEWAKVVEASIASAKQMSTL